jgi:predicted nucleic acid-binding protein
MKGDRTFVDTNILVYAHDSSAGQKRERASRIVLDLWERGLGILSTQVLQEFFVIVTRKIPRPLSQDEAEEIIVHLLNWKIIINDGQAILSAIDVHRRYQYPFWDSLIIQAALAGQANVLLSENFQSGQMIESMRIVNPFK